MSSFDLVFVCILFLFFVSDCDVKQETHFAAI